MEMILEELEYEEILSLCSTSEQFRSLCKESYEKKEILKGKFHSSFIITFFLISLGIGKRIGYPLTPVFTPEFVERYINENWGCGEFGLFLNTNITLRIFRTETNRTS